MASPTQWTWAWVNSGSWWWTGRPGMLQSMEYLHEVHVFISLVQSLIFVWLFATPWTAACQASLFITNSWSLLKLMSIELVMLSNHLILCYPLLLLPSIFPASGSFQMNQFLASGGQSIGVSASAWVLPMNILDWFLLGLTVLLPCCPRDSQVSYNTTVQKHQLFGAKCSLWSNAHIPTWLLKKPELWLDGPSSAK